jgi:hypothetical protein
MLRPDRCGGCFAPRAGFAASVDPAQHVMSLLAAVGPVEIGRVGPCAYRRPKTSTRSDRPAAAVRSSPKIFAPITPAGLALRVGGTKVAGVAVQLPPQPIKESYPLLPFNSCAYGGVGPPSSGITATLRGALPLIRGHYPPGPWKCPAPREKGLRAVGRSQVPQGPSQSPQ